MKVQLFVPPGGYFAERWTKGSSMPPLGLLYIGAILEKEGHDVRIVPAELLSLSWKHIREEMVDFKPDIIGVTSTTENRFQSFELIQKAASDLDRAIADEEMFKTFNMGWGFAVVVDREDAERALSISEKTTESEEIGQVTDTGRIEILYAGNKIVLR